MSKKSKAGKYAEALKFNGLTEKVLAQWLNGDMDILVSLDEDKLDPMWYGNGQRMAVKKNGEDNGIELRCAGEKRVTSNETGLIVYDGKERNEGFDFEIETDKDWAKVYHSGKYIVVRNNWFEIMAYHKEYGSQVWGDPIYNLAEGLCVLADIDVDEVLEQCF